jgi:hypothetical protein
MNYIKPYLDQAEAFALTLPDLYADHVRSENKYIQTAIDWAPSIIMTVGMHVAPYLAIGLSVAAVAAHIKKPEIITNNAIKNILLGAALVIGANSAVPAAKALFQSTTVIVSLLAASAFAFISTHYEVLKEIATYENTSLKKIAIDMVQYSFGESHYALTRLQNVFSNYFPAQQG